MAVTRIACVCLALLAGCATSATVDRYVVWQLYAFRAQQYAAWTTYDTSANTATLELAGSALSGGARMDGAWWVEARSSTGSSVMNVLHSTPYEGRYQVWRDTLYLRDIRNIYGHATWIAALAYSEDGGELVGRWVGDGGWWITVRFRRAI